MLHELSQSISIKISHMQHLNNDIKTEEIAYGLEIIISTVLSIGCIMLLSAFFDMLYECIIFLCFFMPLRTYTGGYHANSHLRCFIVLVIDVLIGIAGIKIINIYSITPNIICFVMIAFSSTITILLTPVVHPNNPLSVNQIHKNRRKSIVILLIEIFVIFLLIMIKNINLYFMSTYGLTSVAISIIIAKIQGGD